MGLRTDEPRPAPYPVGTQVRYTGTTKITTIKDGVEVVVQEPGLVATVTKVRPGWRGTGRLLSVDDEDGYECYDETHDAWSVVEVVPGHGRCIDPDSEDWEEVR
jgi:hypothetical protein